MTDHEQIQRISDVSGLQPSTVLDLLEQGWTFFQDSRKFEFFQ